MKNPRLLVPIVVIVVILAAVVTAALWPRGNASDAAEPSVLPSASAVTSPSTGVSAASATPATTASPAPEAKPIQAEAEDAVLGGGASIESKDAGFSGKGYVFIEKGSAELHVTAAAAGLYELTIGYSAPFGDKKTNLSVNGQSTGEVALTTVNAFKDLSAGKVMLNEGENTIRFDAGWGWYNLDYVKLTPASGKREHQVMKTLVNPNASLEAQALMNYLVDLYGNKILSGQQDYKNLEFLQLVTGKAPAVFSFDLIEYSPSRVEHGSTSTEIENIFDWAGKGGIVSLCWHWNSPSGLFDTEGKEWWRGFYADSTAFDVQKALADKNSEDYRLLLRDIDAIAVQLKRLQDAHIPVLWRPLHEAEGGWFWWGSKGAEPAKELYRLMYDRLTHHHKLNNLIWVWNSVAKDWYPGDDVVDIVSTDIYNEVGDFSPSSNQYDRLVELVNDKKLVALPEDGIIPDPDLLQQYGAHWSWFSTWTGDYLTDGKSNPQDHLKKVFNSDYVITLDELPANLKTYGLSDK